MKLKTLNAFIYNQLKTNILALVHYKLFVYNVYVSSIAIVTILPRR